MSNYKEIEKNGFKLIEGKQGIAISRCPNVQNLTVPAAFDTKPVVAVSPNAFSLCTNTETIISHANCTVPLEFDNCPKLMSVDVFNNEEIMSQKGVVYSLGGDRLLYYPRAREGDYELPSHITEIGPKAFAYSQITSFKGGENLLSVGSAAFIASAIKSIDVSMCHPTFDKFALKSCYNLTDFSLAASSPSIPLISLSNSDKTANVKLYEDGDRPEYIDTISQKYKNTKTTVVITDNTLFNSHNVPYNEYPYVVNFETSPECTKFKTVDGVVYDNSGSTLLRVPINKQGAVVIPDSVMRVVKTVSDMEYNCEFKMSPATQKRLGNTLRTKDEHRVKKFVAKRLEKELSLDGEKRDVQVTDVKLCSSDTAIAEVAYSSKDNRHHYIDYYVMRFNSQEEEIKTLNEFAFYSSSIDAVSAYQDERKEERENMLKLFNKRNDIYVDVYSGRDDVGSPMIDISSSSAASQKVVHESFDDFFAKIEAGDER